MTNAIANPEQSSKKTLWLSLAALAWGLAAFTLFLILFFPYAALVDMFMERYSSKLLVDVSFDEFAPVGLNRIEVSGITLTQKNRPDEALAAIDRVEVGFKWLELRKNVLDLDFNAELLGGAIDGTALIKDQNVEFDLLAERLQIGALAATETLLGELKSRGIVIENLRGRVGATAKGNFPVNHPIQFMGEVTLTGEELAANHGFSIMTGNEEFRLDTLSMNTIFGKNQFRIMDSSASGPDLDARLTGTVKIVKTVRASLSDLQLTLDFKGKLKKNVEPILDIKTRATNKIKKKGDTYTLLIRGPLVTAFKF